MLFRLFQTLALLGSIILFSTASNAQSLVDRGSAAAQKHCARCHVVGSNEFAGIAAALSFFMMSEHIDRYEARLQSVTARHPHIALDLDLNTDDIDALVAYIKQLDWKARWRRIMPRK